MKPFRIICTQCFMTAGVLFSVLASVFFIVAYVRSHHSRHGFANWKKPEGTSPRVIVTVGTEGTRVFGQPFVTAGWIVIGVSSAVGLVEITLLILILKVQL